MVVMGTMQIGFWNPILRTVIVVGCHLYADFISKTMSAPKRGRTMEAMPQENGWSAFIKDAIYYFQGISQVGAILSCICTKSQAVWADVFFSLLPIQLASFLMTLNHKHFDHKNATSR